MREYVHRMWKKFYTKLKRWIKLMKNLIIIKKLYSKNINIHVKNNC